MLMKFLEDQEGNEIWVLTPSGLISGTLNTLENNNAATIILSDAVFYTGDIAVNIGNASIKTDQICGWGDSVPTFIDKEQ